jgi:hypothetical protein
VTDRTPPQNCFECLGDIYVQKVFGVDSRLLHYDPSQEEDHVVQLDDDAQAQWQFLLPSRSRAATLENGADL